MTDQTVECAEDLPLTCAPEAEALNVCDQSDIFCSVQAFTDEGISTHVLTTAEGAGPDAVLRMYGLSAQLGVSSDLFMESPDNPLTLANSMGQVRRT